MRLCLFLLSFILLWGCGEKPPTLKVVATSTPHAEILSVIQSDMEEAGYHLEVIVIDDYYLPNRLLEEGGIDANFFQHLPFLEKEKKEFGYHLKPIAEIHVEPLGIYSQKGSLDAIAKKGIVTVPSDPTNETRALLLLERAGLIKLKRPLSLNITVLDVEENPFGLKIKEIDAPMLVRTLEEVECAVIPGNFALQGGLATPLIAEQKDLGYPNVLVIQDQDEREELQLLAKLLTSEKIASFIQERYKGKIEYQGILR